MLSRMLSRGKTHPLLCETYTATMGLVVHLKDDNRTVSSSSYKKGHTPSVYPNDTSSCNRDTCSTIFIVALFLVASNWKQPRCLTMYEWIKKIRYIYTMKYYSVVYKMKSWNLLNILDSMGFLWSYWSWPFWLEWDEILK